MTCIYVFSIYIDLDNDVKFIKMYNAIFVALFC